MQRSSCWSGCFKIFVWIVDVRSICKQNVWVDGAQHNTTERTKIIIRWVDRDSHISLRFHSVRWLSRGQVMERLFHVMFAILEAFKDEEPIWYQKMTSFQFQFLLHMLVDVLCELNKLNKKFQYDLVDIISIGSWLEVCMWILRRLFLCDTWPTFGRVAKNLGKFLREIVPDISLLFAREDRTEVLYPLSNDPID